MCQCGGQPKVIEEEIEGIEELYGEDDAMREDALGEWTFCLLVCRVTKVRLLGSAEAIGEDQGENIQNKGSSFHPLFCCSKALNRSF